MKKIVILLFASLFALTLLVCGDDGDDSVYACIQRSISGSVPTACYTVATTYEECADGAPTMEIEFTKGTSCQDLGYTVPCIDRGWMWGAKDQCLMKP